MHLRWIPILLLPLLCLSGCPKRDTGEINVDEIQKVVDSVEDHLKSMREALKAKNLAKAEDHYEDAAEDLAARGAGPGRVGVREVFDRSPSPAAPRIASATA